MNKLLAKERVIFENYDGMSDEDIIMCLLENDEELTKEDITDEMIWNERYVQEEIDWDNAKYELDNFFSNINNKLLLTGNVGRWNGVSSGFDVFDSLDKLISFALKDCDYFKFWDENGHLYLCGSHHDGSVSHEIKILTDKGSDYLENWEYSCNDKRSNADVHKALLERYSRLPNFWHKVYGGKVREYEPQSKEKFQKMLRNQAKSYYC